MPRRPMSTFVAVVIGAALLVIGPGAGPLPGPPDAAAGPTAAVAGPAAVRLEGRGYGHGRGMSQYGAQGAASQHGRTHRQILRFYYPGTEWGTAGGPVSVLITADTTADVVVGDRPRLTVRSLGSGKTFPLARDGARQWRITPSDGGSNSRVWVLTDRWQPVRNLAGAAEFGAGGRPVRLITPHGSTRYRGVLRSAIPGSGSGRDTVNVVSLEDYLRGVVPREVPALWHPQAVRAQAVAARTYAAFERRAPLAKHYQICDTSSCQVYGGASAEHPASDDAIRATRGVVLTRGGTPAFTQFSASNGGWTVAGSVPYLPAQEDRWDPWSGNPHRRWTVKVPASAIERAYPGIGDFQRLTVRSRDGNGAWNGRVLRIRIVGSKGATAVSGDTFRVVFGLRSTWFRVI